MQVKIDTKEKFAVVTPIPPELSANIAAEIRETAMQQLQEAVKNIVLSLSAVRSITNDAIPIIVELQQSFYEQNASFVICCIQPSVEEAFANAGQLEMLNCTPTESEAWDIVQMEEIERELLDGDDVEFGTNS